MGKEKNNRSSMADVGKRDSCGAGKQKRCSAKSLSALELAANTNKATGKQLNLKK